MSEHEDDTDVWPDMRPGHAPHRDDGWRGQQVREDPGAGRIPAGRDLFLHCCESSALVTVATLVLAGLLPSSVSWQLLVLAVAALAAVTFYTALKVTGSLPVSCY